MAPEQQVVFDAHLRSYKMSEGAYFGLGRATASSYGSTDWGQIPWMISIDDQQFAEETLRMTPSQLTHKLWDALEAYPEVLAEHQAQTQPAEEPENESTLSYNM
jgi:hypothetical protein